MGLLSATDIKKRKERAIKALERKIAKHKANLADPEWRKEQNEKRVAAANRYRQNQLDRAKEARTNPPKNAIATKPKKATSNKAVKTTKKATGKGLLGRTPTAAEARVMEQIGALPCECCARMGRYSPVISLHHTNGRSDPLAHMENLPLCCWHHDTPASKDVLIKYPDLIPVHAKGSLGGKAAWEEIFGKQADMLVDVWEKLDLIPVIAAELTKINDTKLMEIWRSRYPKIDLFELPNQ